LLIAFETSQQLCSVAILSKNGVVIDQLVVDEINNHAKNLPLMTNEILKNNGYHFNNLSGVAVSKGPGSYTGLRIAAAYAKGICFGLNIPLIAVSTLRAMAAQLNIQDSSNGMLLVPMIDARRMEVYAATFNKEELLDEERAIILDKNYFQNIEGYYRFFGNGAEKIPTDWITKDQEIIKGIKPIASVIGKLALVKLKNKEFEDLDSFEPNYIKSFRLG
tara:strand:- start:1205 stop:1861 length:657 start_codon:yes stop_codon:yes gene_type:complete